jgi:8-oxo-dGTP pyrophosphatase MutT (NUDIX family)
MAAGVEEARAEREARLGVDPYVRAAGGVVIRSRDGAPEVLLVHRPKYDDWTFPKGKAAPGESDEDCAIREVEEETGLRCALTVELAGTSYSDSRGRPKRVRYWAMRAESGGFTSHAEVDEIRWLPLDEAAAALIYARDRDVLASLPEVALP